VVRNPYDRAWSMFQYWKYGSDIFTRTPEFLAENEHVTFEWFLDRIQFNPERVYGDFLWDVHFFPTSHWLDSSDYHNTVAMEYYTDMNDSLQKLFRKNDIIDKGVVLRTVNPTSGKAGHQWTSNERLRVERIFASDFDLLRMMQTKPELFNQVIAADEQNNNEKCGRLSFIHPTKSGGTAIEKFLSEYYSDQIDVQVGHKRTSRDVDCSLIVVRNPYDRAWSMFQYWKYGSDIFTRTPEFLAENEHVTFEWFLDRIQFNPERVYGDFLWDVHFFPTSHWLDSSDYHNTVAMEYYTDMNDSLQKLFRKNDIIDKGVVLRTVNPTSGKAGHQWTSNERLRVERIFASDFYLLNMMQNKPELFNQVIRR